MLYTHRTALQHATQQTGLAQHTSAHNCVRQHATQQTGLARHTAAQNCVKLTEALELLAWCNNAMRSAVSCASSALSPPLAAKLFNSLSSSTVTATSPLSASKASENQHKHGKRSCHTTPQLLTKLHRRRILGPAMHCTSASIEANGSLAPSTVQQCLHQQLCTYSAEKMRQKMGVANPVFLQPQLIHTYFRS